MYQSHPHLCPSKIPFLCLSPSLQLCVWSSVMAKRPCKQQKTTHNPCCSQEVSSWEWEIIVMNEQEQDLIYRMHKLVGDRWELIAGRIPGRRAEEIERFWIMTRSQWFPNSRNV